MMAHRYGGKFSPGAVPKANRRPPPLPYAARVNLLYLAALPFGISAFWQDPVGLLEHLCAFALLAGGAFMTREGVKAKAAYDTRRIARRPALPRKLLGAVMTGGSLALAAAPPDGTILGAAIVGTLGIFLHTLSFGLDPLRDKRGDDATDLFQTDRVARVVDEAERYLADISGTIDSLGDRRLSERVARLVASVRAMCRRVEDDPRDLTAARRYLGVYLLGTRDATRKFAGIHGTAAGRGARADYEELLDDLEARIAERMERMLLDDSNDFGLEIDVLKQRLEQDRLRHEQLERRK